MQEGWIACKMQNAVIAWMLYHPTKHICYRTSISIGPQKSFFIPTKEGKKWLTQSGNHNQLNSMNPGVSRYIGVGAWGRLKLQPGTKLIVDADEFLAFNYGV